MEAITQLQADAPAAGAEMLTTPEAARYLGMSVVWLKKSRAQPSGGPPFYRATAKAIRYRRSDLDNWLAARREDKPSQQSPKPATRSRRSTPLRRKRSLR